jgi:serine protease AprX
MKRAATAFLLFVLLSGQAQAGLDIVRSSGITLTGADGINYIGTSGITLTGADGFLPYQANGITLTGADGITLTGADGITLTGADASTYTGTNGITLTGADGITLTGADGITLTGADGITLTGADGTQYKANSILVNRPDGITLTGADGITLTGADGITLTGADGATRVGPNGVTLTGADGITLTGADGITLTGADGITLTGADSVIGIGPNGIVFEKVRPAGITLTGADGITLTGADGITLTGADGITLTGADGITLTGADSTAGLQSVDPELAMTLNKATDDSSINAVVAFHSAVTDSDIHQLRSIGILGGTRFRSLPLVYVSGTRQQILAISRLQSVRSVYGNRSLTFNSDPYFKPTGVERVSSDNDLSTKNAGLPVTGRNVTVAVLDTGINSQHPDLAGKVVQNVRLLDTQSVPAGFVNPIPVENVPNTDPVAGHGTFVAGVIAASGSSSGGKYSGVAPGVRLVGLSAGDANLTSVLSGFDYLLEKGTTYNVKVVNCSFSANTVYDPNDPINIATKMLADRGVNVVFSAGNAGPGNSTLNPYAAAPWVVSVGATDEKGLLAGFSSRGTFGGYGNPTLVAPGANVASLRNIISLTSATGLTAADTKRLSPTEMLYYTTASGTSFSAPQVAGAIAMMLEANPALKPAEIKDILSRTATPLPKYFLHEAGAGMLNTHSAVLESAFPDRRMGIFRSTLSRNAISFVSRQTQSFTETVSPGSERSVTVAIPQNVIQASVSISWGLGPNDFALKLFSGSNLVGESNYLNLPGLTGAREKIVLRSPAAQTYRAAIQHTVTGRAQNVYGAVDVTQVEYPELADLDTLAPELAAEAERSLLSNILLPEGKSFRPNWPVFRSELAAAFVRAGLVSQYVGSKPLYTDVRDISTRNFVESVQMSSRGRLVFDAGGERFSPHSFASRLVAVVALVKAADLESSAKNAVMPSGVQDVNDIPLQWRGHFAIALERGLIRLQGNRANSAWAITRLELAQSINSLIR